MKTLILRTDKLGDFYVTIPYINCLKRAYGKKNVDVVVKKHIYTHIKKKSFLYNKLYSFPEKGIFKKILLVLKLRKQKYKQLIILDGKDRSIILSKFLNVNKIFITYPKKKINFFTKILFSKKYKTFIDNQAIPLKFLYKAILDKVGVKIIKKDYKILLHKDVKKINMLKKENIKNNKYSLIHLDEKWLDIPDVNINLATQISNLQKNLDHSIILTSYDNNFDYFNNLKKIFTTINFLNDKINLRVDSDNNKIFILENMSLPLFEKFISKSILTITCHSGFPIHICGANSTHYVDIINKNVIDWVDCWIPKNTKYSRIYKTDLPTIFKNIEHLTKNKITN